MKTVDISTLQQHLDIYLRLVGGGERIIVRDGDRAIAELIPATGERPVDPHFPEPLQLPGDPYALSEALAETRGEVVPAFVELFRLPRIPEE